MRAKIPRTGITSRTSSILAWFRLLAWELLTLERSIDFGKCCPDNSDLIFDRVFIRLACNENSYKIIDESGLNTTTTKCWTSSISSVDRTIYMRITCPLVPHWHIIEENVKTIATSFLIWSSSNLQIMRIGIISQISDLGSVAAIGIRVTCLWVSHRLTSLGEERANLSAFRTFVRFVLV